MSSANAAKLKRKGADFEQKKQFEKALPLYVQVLEEAGRDLEDADVPLFNRVGDLLMRQGSVSEALGYYERAVDMYAERGFLNNAIALCNKILRQSPARSAVYYKLGKISASKGFKADAKRNFLEYADRMQKAGQLDEAFRALKEFADLCPDQDDIRLMLAEWLTKENRKHEALEEPETSYTKLDAEGRDAEARATADRIHAVDPAVDPRVSGSFEAHKSNDLVFLDLAEAETPSARQRNPEAQATPRSAAAIPTASLGSGVSALEGLTLTFMPSDDNEYDEPSSPVTALHDLVLPSDLPRLEESADTIDEITSRPLDSLRTDELSMADGTPIDLGDLPPLEQRVDDGTMTRVTSETPLATDRRRAAPESDRYFESPIVPRKRDTAELAVMDGPGRVTEEIVVVSDQDLSQSASNGPHEHEDYSFDAGETSDDWARAALAAKDELDLDRFLVPYAGTGDTDRRHDASIPLDASPGSDADTSTTDGPHSADAVAAEWTQGTAAASDAAGDADIDLLDELTAPFLREGRGVAAARDADEAIPRGTHLHTAEVEGAFEDRRADVPLLDADDLFDPEDDPAPKRGIDESTSASGAIALRAELSMESAGLLDSVADFRSTPDAELPEMSPVPFEWPEASSVSDSPDRGHRNTDREIVAQRRDRVKAEPENASLRRSLGEALLDDGERDEGLLELERAVRGFERAGDLDGARDVTDVVLRLLPQSVRHHQKQVEYAVRSNDRPRLISAYVELADALFQKGEVEKAAVVFSRVVELSPDNEPARFALALIGGTSGAVVATSPDATVPSRDDEATPVARGASPVDAGSDTSREEEEIDAAFATPSYVDAVVDAPSLDVRPDEAGPQDQAPESSGDAAALSPSHAAPFSPVIAAGDDEDFVDLGEWLRDTEPARSTRMVTGDAAPSGDEQADFDTMLRRFKQGVAENVDEEDYDSHYDLGVAFKEMGLIGEAIAQFQKALRGDAHRVRSYEALGQCFVEKGQLQVAIALLTRAIETTGADDQLLVGVLYLLAYASEGLQRHADALGYYQRVFAVDIEFRDIEQRVAAMERFLT